ncbi:hypothetical protein PMI08_04221 [Brevibacillus sp. CF112]|nr:hypothetical protein PMI08_04221 [Brevibacillus sp. CF112]
MKVRVVYASRLMKGWEVRQAAQNYMAREILKRYGSKGA